MSTVSLPVRARILASYPSARTLARSIQEQAGNPLFAGPYLAFDHYGRIASAATSVANRLGFDDDRILGRRLSHQIAASQRGQFTKMLVQARLVGTFASTEFFFWTRWVDAGPATLVSRALIAIEQWPVFVAVVHWRA